MNRNLSIDHQFSIEIDNHLKHHKTFVHYFTLHWLKLQIFFPTYNFSRKAKLTEKSCIWNFYSWKFSEAEPCGNNWNFSENLQFSKCHWSDLIHFQFVKDLWFNYPALSVLIRCNFLQYPGEVKKIQITCHAIVSKRILQQKSKIID